MKKRKFLIFLIGYTLLFWLASWLVMKFGGINSVWGVIWFLNFPVMSLRFANLYPLGKIADFLFSLVGLNIDSNLGLTLYYYIDGVIFYLVFFSFCFIVYRLLSIKK